MPREPKHASNRQAEEFDADPSDLPVSKRQAAIDGTAPSRNELKKQMQDLQELGEAVAALPADRLDKLPIDERLRDAIDELRRTRSFEGRRRQLQDSGKVMKAAMGRLAGASVDGKIVNELVRKKLAGA